MERGAGGLGDGVSHERYWVRVFLSGPILVYSNAHTCRYFFTAVAFLPLLSAAHREGHTGAVINISSISGITRTTQHHFKYNVSKAATIQLTQLLAQEFRRPGVKVRVNSIAPGIFPSEMTGA